MPIYEYRCSACGASFEQLIRTTSEQRRVACPECGSRRVERQLSVVAIGRSSAKSAPAPGACGECCATDGSCSFE